MLIRSIKAENFMRFARLDIRDIPTDGIIGVEGPNESGKTTVGDALLFALFGKTRLSSGASVVNLIRWGSDSLTVEVVFSVGPPAAPAGDGVPPCEYLLFRQIDRAGTNYVKVLELPGRVEVASGNAAVAEFIASRAGFDFQEFRSSFYFDQGESRRIEAPHAGWFEAAMGVREIRQALSELRDEVNGLEAEFAFHQKEIARNLAQGGKYEKNVAKLPALTARLPKLEAGLGQVERRVAELRQRRERLDKEAARLEERARRVVEVATLSLAEMETRVQALGQEDETQAGAERSEVTGAGAGAPQDLAALRSAAADLKELQRLAAAEHADLEGKLDSSVKAGLPASRAELAAEAGRLVRKLKKRTLAMVVLGAVAAAAAVIPLARGSRVDLPAALGSLPVWPILVLAIVLFVVSLARGAAERKELSLARRSLDKLDGELAALGEVRTRLAAILALSSVADVPRLIASCESSGIRSLAIRAAAIRERHPWLLAADGRIEGQVQARARADRDARSRILAEAERAGKQVQEGEAQIKVLRADKERLEAELRECRSQLAKREALSERNREIETGVAGLRAEIDARLLACRLLEETAAALLGRAAIAVGRFVKSILSALTLGRYREVKVERDLQVRLFSSDKNDFLSAHELSGGTGEVLTLALRLALSQAFVSARTRQGQFVFLDEPFQMMDAERAAETLRVLRALSPDLLQFFVVQPNFSAGERGLFHCRVETRPGEVELDASCSPGARTTPEAALVELARGLPPEPRVPG
jgi:DNA repair exonuclease SbcCD ATPase subunit